MVALFGNYWLESAWTFVSDGDNGDADKHNGLDKFISKSAAPYNALVQFAVEGYKKVYTMFFWVFAVVLRFLSAFYVSTFFKSIKTTFLAWPYNAKYY